MDDGKLDPRVARELALFDQELVDLEEVLDTHIRTLKRQVEGLRNETVGDTVTAAKNRAVSEAAVKKGKELTLSLVAAVQAKGALEKQAEARKKSMTAQERLDALQRFVMKLPYPDRRGFLLALLGAHSARTAEARAAGLELTPTNAVVGGPTTSFVEVL